MSNGLTPKDFTDQRNDAMREGVKALLLMNGGGAVALLAFLQAIWSTDPPLAKVVISSLPYFLVGVVLAALVHLFRYHTSNDKQYYLVLLLHQHRPDNDPEVMGAKRSAEFYTKLYFWAAYLSLALFVFGVYNVLSGASCILSYGCMP